MGGCSSQKSQAEYRPQSPLLASAHVQVAKEEERQNHYGEIGQYAYDRCSLKHIGIGRTTEFVLRCEFGRISHPEGSDGVASEDQSQDNCDSMHDDYTHENGIKPGENLSTASRQDAFVEEQNRDFKGRCGGRVNMVQPPEVLFERSEAEDREVGDRGLTYAIST